MLRNREVKNIERFFLNTLLSVSIGGLLLVLISDVVFFPEDTLSISIDLAILAACLVAYLIRNRYPVGAVLTLTTIVLAAMIYQCLVVPANTTTSLSIMLVVGFIHSVMLKRHIMWAMHVITFGAINSVFVIQVLNPSLAFSQKTNEVVTVAITYSILYFILTYATAVLKMGYDRIHQYLKDTNRELYQKADEIAAQNEALIQVQENLNELNKNLEQKVIERTQKIQMQNEILLKYSYTNAHHLRGPVARLLGLASIYKLEQNVNPDDFIQKMVDQANEIDSVVKKINTDLINTSPDGVRKN